MHIPPTIIGARPARRSRRAWTALAGATALATLVACGGADPGGGTTTPPPPVSTAVSVTKAGGDGQVGVVGIPLGADVVVTVRDGEGRPRSGARVLFTVAAGGGATGDTAVTTGADGRAATAWYLGATPGAAQRLRATVDTASAEFTATAEAARAGQTYFGRNQYVEYIAGDSPVILTAPHGGSLTPSEIPDRTVGTTATDLNTEPLARAVADAIAARTGRRPHVVIAHLRRTKLDANREIVEAAAGNRAAMRAWAEYHGFVDAAKQLVVGRSGRGFYIDLHGHGHEIQRLELGYLLTNTELNLGDAAVDAATIRARTSIRALGEGSPLPFSRVLRGAESLGTMLERRGFPSVPSASQPSPGSAPYFDGGYSTARHGSRDGGTISGVQIESNFTGVRDTAANRARFAAALAEALAEYMGMHLGVTP